MFYSALVVLISFLLGLCILRPLIPKLFLYCIDTPNERSSHFLPTPRGGGISFVIVSSLCSLFLLLFHSFAFLEISSFMLLPLMAMPLALVGFRDDRHGLPAYIRYFFQFVTAFSIVFFSPIVFPILGHPFLVLVLTVLVTAVINFVNFMDGLDGLVAGCMIFAISAISIRLSAPLPVWALIGSLLAFLAFNWFPAKVFMGDVGSTFLGAVFSALVLQGSTWFDTFVMLLVLTPLLFDAFICLLRRLLAGHHVFQAHRLHLFQRLHQAGWTHARVSSMYIFGTAIIAVALLFGGPFWVFFLSSLELFIGLWLDQRVAVNFAVASRS